MKYYYYRAGIKKEQSNITVHNRKIITYSNEDTVDLYVGESEINYYMIIKDNDPDLKDWYYKGNSDFWIERDANKEEIAEYERYYKAWKLMNR